MSFKNQEIVELTMMEIDAVSGAGEPINNPPGITLAMAMIENDPEPVNDPHH